MTESKEFPDYIDYLPHGAIVRKIPKMTVREELLQPIEKYISITKYEVEAFRVAVVDKVTERIQAIKTEQQFTNLIVY